MLFFMATHGGWKAAYLRRYQCHKSNACVCGHAEALSQLPAKSAMHQGVENFLKLGGGSTALSGCQVCSSADIHMIEAGNIGDVQNLPQLDGGSSLQG